MNLLNWIWRKSDRRIVRRQDRELRLRLWSDCLEYSEDNQVRRYLFCRCVLQESQWNAIQIAYGIDSTERETLDEFTIIAREWGNSDHN